MFNSINEQLAQAEQLHNDAIKVLSDLKLQIGWTRFALLAPKHLTTAELQAMQKAKLTELLKSLEIFTRAEFQFKTEVERLQTKIALQAIRSTFIIKNGRFHIT